MNNRQRIIEALQGHAGLDDDELSNATGIRPRQQVNQICRRLASEGVLARVRGEHGKILNVLSENVPIQGRETTPDVQVQRRGRSDHRSESADVNLSASDRQSTLFVICCSWAKNRGSSATGGHSILAYLPDSLAGHLRNARRAVAARSELDEGTLLPAWRRYCGQLYQAAGPIIARAIEADVNIVILSGGYGIVLADEPIGFYNRRFRCSDWPDGLLETVLLKFVERQGLKRVRALASATGDYGELLRRVPWAGAGIQDAWMLSPEKGLGAMVRSPRAQGEAFAALLGTGLTPDWRSSDDLGIDVIPLV